MENRIIAKRLMDHASLLESREFNMYRVRAYRKAAEVVLNHTDSVSGILTEQGRTGLEELPGIGKHLSYAIECLIRTGEVGEWDGAGHADSERLFATIPGIGAELARRIHRQLGVQTLEELEKAANDQRLSELRLGPKKLQGIINALECRLTRRRLPEPFAGEPPIGDLLALDSEYRRSAERGKLPTVAPRRFNLYGDPCVPLLRINRNGWSFRVLFSNTALAHRLGKTDDWVVIYFDDAKAHGQRTIVTETRGDFGGKRVVRGREEECRFHYNSLKDVSPVRSSG